MAIAGRGIWIKVETVRYDNINDTMITNDITEDILSTGVTERAPISSEFSLLNYNANQDSRSIIKLQRFSMPGGSLPNPSGTLYSHYATLGGVRHALSVRYSGVTDTCFTTPSSCSPLDVFAGPFPSSRAASTATSANEDAAHLYRMALGVGSTNYQYAIAPFPIKIFDSREGLPHDDSNAHQTAFGTANVPAAGVMSVVDIDVANLRSFLNGNWDGLFPTDTPFAASKGNVGLRSTDVPENAGWVVYVSDRRGDHDFDGEYDMEDVFPNGIREYNEDVNNNNVLDVDFTNEAVTYTTSVARGQAALADHAYYRRGVRLINGTVLPGSYDTSGLGNTKGFTVASENGVYVQGNYNTTGVSVSTGTAVTPPTSYFPQNTSEHIPASIVSDAVTILSNSWSDSNAFLESLLSCQPTRE